MVKKKQNTKKSRRNKSVAVTTKLKVKKYKVTRDSEGNYNVLVKTHKDSQGGHPHFIYGDLDNKHVSVGFSTQQKKGKSGGMNYALQKSPFNDGKKSYMRRQGIVAPKYTYKDKSKGNMTEKDYKQAEKYCDVAVDKYIKNKKGKK